MYLIFPQEGINPFYQWKIALYTLVLIRAQLEAKFRIQLVIPVLLLSLCWLHQGPMKQVLVRGSPEALRCATVLFETSCLRS